jgi:hypothetical protein
LSETFLILRRIDIIINAHRYSCKAPVILVGFLKKLRFSRQIFEKLSNIKFHENPYSGSRAVACGRTDGQAFRNFANAPKIGLDLMKRNPYFYTCRPLKLRWDNASCNYCRNITNAEVCALLGYYAAPRITTRRCVILQKGADLIHISAEA